MYLGENGEPQEQGWEPQEQSWEAEEQGWELVEQRMVLLWNEQTAHKSESM